MTVRSWRSWVRAALVLATALAGAAALAQPAAARLAGVFGDHMVLQRDAPIRIWGWAPAGSSVRVGFRGHAQATQADARGRWQLQLPAAPAGGPHELTLQGAVALRDVLVGDVWLCTGQSNMEWPLSLASDGSEAIAASDLPLIRHVQIAKHAALQPQDDLPAVTWQVSSPATAGAFSAVGFHFARRLQRDQKVPIGLVNLAWGGTHIETWTRREALAEDPAFAPLLRGLPDTPAAWAGWQQARTQRVLDRWQPGLPAAGAAQEDADPARWAHPDFNDARWPTLRVPQAWEQQGLDGLDGVVWYRREITLDEAQARTAATLHLGTIDDCDETWVNGQRVGDTAKANCAWDQPRHYTLPAGSLHAGRNVIAVRVTDTGGGGGFYGAADAVNLQLAEARLPLAGSWQARVERGPVSAAPTANDLPSLLHNGMVQPLVPMRIKGALWYQGESNVPRAQQYIASFQRLITDLRRQWGQGAFPFYFVQLASFLPLANNSLAASPWAELRDAQRQALALPNTGMVVATDVGDAKDIHPRNKRAVGERLAYHALKASGLPAPGPDGPVFKGMTLRGAEAWLRFTLGRTPGGANGLRTDTPGAALRGFAIAGADGRFVPAQARIQGARVRVWSPQVPQPVAVRFGWVDNPEQSNLFDRNGLPASPFRSDAGAWATQGSLYRP
jgi:sialate O-acetylesterase